MLKKIFVSRDNLIYENNQSVYWLEKGSVFRGKTGRGKGAKSNQRVSVIKNSIEKVETYYYDASIQQQKIIKILKKHGVKTKWRKSKVKA